MLTHFLTPNHFPLISPHLSFPHIPFPPPLSSPPLLTYLPSPTPSLTNLPSLPLLTHLPSPQSLPPPTSTHQIPFSLFPHSFLPSFILSHLPPICSLTSPQPYPSTHFSVTSPPSHTSPYLFLLFYLTYFPVFPHSHLSSPTYFLFSLTSLPPLSLTFSPTYIPPITLLSSLPSIHVPLSLLTLCTFPYLHHIPSHTHSLLSHYLCPSTHFPLLSHFSSPHPPPLLFYLTYFSCPHSPSITSLYTHILSIHSPHSPLVTYIPPHTPPISSPISLYLPLLHSPPPTSAYSLPPCTPSSPPSLPNSHLHTKLPLLNISPPLLPHHPTSYFTTPQYTKRWWLD